MKTLLFLEMSNLMRVSFTNSESQIQNNNVPIILLGFSFAKESLFPINTNSNKNIIRVEPENLQNTL